MSTQDADERIPDVVRAKAFEVVDDAGEVRAMLYMCATDNPRLSLYNATGELQVVLDSHPHGALLLLQGNNAQLQLVDDDSCQLTLSGDDPRLELSDETGRRIWRVGGVSFGP